MNYLLFLKAFQEKYANTADKGALFNYLREELQYLILGFLFTKTSYPIYFMGGTKLRLSYKINRFSEDIDFALDKPDPDFPSGVFFKDIESAFSEKITGFKLHAKSNARRNVVKIMLAFAQILYDLKLSPLPDETIKIKIELDINPPAHAQYEQKQYRSLLSDYRVNTHDLATGFAGKLGAVLEREYQKGRDYYDLQWYLQQTPPVLINLDYFNANSVQLQRSTFKTSAELLKAVTKKVEALDLNLLKKDLERFVLMDPGSFEQWLQAYPAETAALLEAYLKRHEG
ncbi:nucleotidyl transferase AbiEii/AbiGii toxin family protein [Candidatus Peregrinibacteria bacterium]|nr:nucleotidyl transferase AbiEii/AbiGii toxin family protein [Candidatus Peregrinibacteria bacterium]